MTRKFALLLMMMMLAAVVLWAGCGDDSGDDEEDCPSFDDMQLLPEIGDAETEYVLFVEFKNNNANKNLETVRAVAYFADGRSAGVTLDLVRLEDRAHKYLRTFAGDEVCEADTCTLFFEVTARHESGCTRGFDTPLFQVVIDEPVDDDTTD